MFEYFRRNSNGMSILATPQPANPLIRNILCPKYPLAKKTFSRSGRALHRRQNLRRRPLIRRIPRTHLAILPNQRRRERVRQRPRISGRDPQVEKLLHRLQLTLRRSRKVPMRELLLRAARVDSAIALQDRRRIELRIEADAQKMRLAVDR